MVHWFSPTVLLHTLQQVIASTLFGQYADKRLIHASLDVVGDDGLVVRTGGLEGICPRDGSGWVDYVADLGDGFDSTYAIAYLLGRPSLGIGDQQLPRAHCLVMGGDQVY